MFKRFFNFWRELFSAITNTAYKESLRLYNHGDYKAAAESFAKLRARGKLTILYRRLTDFYYFRALRNAGILNFYQKDYQSCVNHFQNALNLRTESLTCHNYLAHSYNQLGQIERSIEHLKVLRMYWPSREDILLKLGISYIRLNRIKEGIGTLTEIVKREGGDNFPDVNLILGIAYLKSGSFDKAVSHLQRAVEVNPSFSVAYCALGCAFLLSDNLKESRRAFERSSQISPEDEKAAGFLGVMNALPPRKDQDYRDQIAELRRKAIGECDHLLVLKIEYGEHFTFLDPIYDNHCINELIEVFESLCTKHPDYADYANNLARFYLKVGEIGKAKSFFLRALKLNPYYVEALDGLAAIYEKQDDPERALEIIDNILLQTPVDPIVLLIRSRLCITLERYEDAVHSMLMATHSESEYAHHLYLLGQILEKKGYLEWARQCWIHVEEYLPGLASKDIRRTERALRHSQKIAREKNPER